MSIKIVVLKFDAYDGELVPFDLFSTDPLPVEYFQVRLFVRAPYYSETFDDQTLLVRRYMRRFKEIKNRFIKKIAPEMEDLGKDIEENLQRIKSTVTTLREMLENELVIPDQIEIGSIELVGEWPIFEPAKESQMKLELNKQDLKDIQALRETNDRKNLNN
ncbi:hypothetical protein Lpp27_10876 [Lacticaseibacillus paracasei subsp. paracasei CNCM I-4648]|jgi:hypothetical protein|uniref:hypothetical protein n=1 Tax=Lacticaseibacillus paracasei TaxID=1597 RepID=UPI000297958E|nr:hypothetical protein [Lacticaseibacillus paracasei]EKQ23660.1 hypothetical protein LCAUW1_0834 [Lacticaseibacillus paracasei]EPC96224.1 hypothetical protein Lpp27_10876 [Lacticaseibacillus paracasei subsp. paracasei CNCM I-4648]MDM7525624.1 hypothetical protein [Lacticaseibacillus paracasei]RND67121.1 hypothetical protein FAM18126_00949 [Lacticaseibacillus paracasei]